MSRVTLVYLLGLAGVGGYTALGIAQGEGLAFAALWGVLTLAWAFGYWAVMTPITILLELRRLYVTMREEHRRTGKVALDPQGRAFLIEQAAEAASRGTPIPGFIMERLVTRVVDRMQAQARAEAEKSGPDKPDTQQP